MSTRHSLYGSTKTVKLLAKGACVGKSIERQIGGKVVHAIKRRKTAK